MKRLLMFCAVVAFFFNTNAQIRYEDLEKYSKTISEIQFRSQPFYTSADKVTFPEENFKVFFSTKLASLGYYSEDKQGEDLCIQEGIDLTKAKGIFFQKDQDGAEYISIILNTPGIMKVIKNESQRSVKSSNLFFFFKKGSESDKKLLFDNLSQLILLFKNNEAPAMKEKQESELRDWKAVQKQNNYKGYDAFVKKYPGSIFSMEASSRMEEMSPVKDFINAYKAGYNRTKQYQALWGHWKPGESILKYDGVSKNIRDDFKTENFRFAEPMSKKSYFNTNIEFSFNADIFFPYSNYASAKRDIIQFAKRNGLFPRDIGVNGKKEIVYLRYNAGLESSFLSDFATYLGYSYDEVKYKYSNSKEYFWYFDDCTIEYQVINGQYETTQDLKLYYHDKGTMVPNGNFTFQKEGATFEITPAIWKKYYPANQPVDKPKTEKPNTVTQNNSSNNQPESNAFERFSYFKEFELGITLSEAKKRQPEFFSKTKAAGSKLGESIISLSPEVMASSKDRVLGVYVKNDRLYGYYGLIFSGVDDANFSTSTAKINNLAQQLNAIWGFSYTETRSTAQVTRRSTQNVITKTWEKNGRTFIIEQMNGVEKGVAFSTVFIYLADSKRAL